MSSESTQNGANMADNATNVADNGANVAQSGQKEALQTEASQNTQTEQRSKKRDENFRRMEAKMMEMESRLKAAEAEKAALQQNNSSPEDSDLVTAGQMKRLIAEEARRIANETVQKRDLDTLGDRLQMKHPDFNEVVSEDAVDDLRESHPEIFQSLKANPDPYSKGLAAYKFIKMMKGQDNSKATAKANEKANEKKIEENRAKPNVGATNTSVLSQASGWVKPSAEIKRQAYAEMKQAAARRG